MKKVLIIEDDPEIISLLEIHLKDLSCETAKASDGKLGLELAETEEFNLIILDLMLPKMDGIEVCQKLRGKGVNTPILMLTAKSEEIDRVLGLEMGADDYMTKPFSVREFIARVKAIFRRTQMIRESLETDAAETINWEGLSIDIEKRKVLINDNKVELSPKEFELLILLASNPGKSYNRSNLLNLIWGYEFEGYEHTVNSHINRLRAKIEPDMANPKYILTTWGVGYKFNEELDRD
ncbi:MAG: response regulator transcription factor [Cyclobacteriaceae bacterium]